MKVIGVPPDRPKVSIAHTISSTVNNYGNPNNWISFFYGLPYSFFNQKTIKLRSFANDPKWDTSGDLGRYVTKAVTKAYNKPASSVQQLSRRVKAASNLADDTEAIAKRFDRFGKVVLVAGAIIDGISTGADYYDHHRKEGVAKAVGVGILHAGASTVGSVAGSYVGEAAGAALGTALIPIPIVGTLVGGAIGGAVGGYLGGALGDALADKMTGWF